MAANVKPVMVTMKATAMMIEMSLIWQQVMASAVRVDGGVNVVVGIGSGI